MSTNIMMPKLGMTMKEGTVEEWHVQEGDSVNKGDIIVSISSEKLTQDVEAPADGTIIKITTQAGEEAKVKTPIGVIGESGETVEESEQENSSEKDETSEERDVNSNDTNESPSPKEVSATQNEGERIFISPLARNMADKNNLDISRIEGTGGNGRITKLDIQRVLENGLDKESQDTTDTPSAASVPSSTAGEGLNPIRKRIAQNMRQSLEQTAQLTLHRKVNADPLLSFKEKLATELSNAGQDVKLSITALVAKAVVLSLKEYKKINVRYENGELQEFDEVHLGIATSLDDGLMVPVIKEADSKSIGALANEIKDAAEKVRNGETNDVALSGATFTITNMGTSEIEYFTPILNVGEAGILGVGAMQSEVVIHDGNVKQIQRLPLSLTFDHQLLDGADVVLGHNTVIQKIEEHQNTPIFYSLGNVTSDDFLSENKKGLAVQQSWDGNRSDFMITPIKTSGDKITKDNMNVIEKTKLKNRISHPSIKLKDTKGGYYYEN